MPNGNTIDNAIALDEFKEHLNTVMANSDAIKTDLINSLNEYGSAIRYDDKGNIIYLRSKDGTEQHWEYGKWGVTYYSNSSNNQWDRYEYDVKGNVTKHTNQDNEITTFEYNDKNSLIKKTIEKGQDINIFVYEYDDKDRLLYFREDNKFAIRREYLDETDINYIEYKYNGEQKTTDISYHNYSAGVKSVELLENGTKKWYEDDQMIKEIPSQSKRKV